MDITQDLIARFEAHRDADRANGMEAYQRHQFQFFGLQANLRRELQKQWLDAHGKPIIQGNLLAIAHELFQFPQRECQYTAVDILVKFGPKQLSLEDLPALETFVTTLSWWDTVDILASSVIGPLLKNRPDVYQAVTQRWIDSGNLWLQRTAILFQLNYKRDTDTELLKRVIAQLLPNRDFFIRKAIGWALRQYARENAEWVRQTLDELRIEGLSRREALKHINN
jgi:3-methyladenine DNA glycosylase AlkD